MHNHSPTIRLVFHLTLTWLFLVGCASGAAATAAPASIPLVTGPADTVSAVTAPAEPLARRVTQEIKHEIAEVQPWLDRYGYGAVALAVGLEGVGIPTPGQTLLMAAAADAATTHKLQIGWLLAAAFLAATVGNTLGYLIGRWGGRALLRRLRVSDRHLERVEAGFARWGGWLIVLARFFDGPRQLNGIAAGILEMPWPRFALFNALGAALWTGTWALGIFYLDENLHGILVVIRQLNPWVLGATLVVTAGLIILFWRWYRGLATKT